VVDAVSSARSLYGELSSASERIEAARRLPEDVAELLKRSQLFRLCVPQRYGGLEASPRDMIGAIAEVARADGSAGWCVAIGATSGLVAGYLAEQDAREIYADPMSVAGGVFAPRGQAIAGDDGYTIAGRWPFASGMQHCTWLMGGCIVMRDGKPALLPSGIPDSRLALFPADQARLIDTWSVSGLCGTGSHDMEVDALRVPERRAVSLMTDRPVIDDPLYKFPVFGMLAVGIASVSLGLARRAIEELVTLAGGKTPTGSRRRLADRAYIQMQVAQAEAALGSGRAFLLEVVDETWTMASTQAEIPVPQRARLRLAASNAVTQCIRAVDLMYEAGGGTSIYRSSPLQRCFRDIHAASQHLMVASSTYELAGRVLLGLETDAAML